MFVIALGARQIFISESTLNTFDTRFFYHERRTHPWSKIVQDSSGWEMQILVKLDSSLTKIFFCMLDTSISTYAYNYRRFSTIIFLLTLDTSASTYLLDQNIRHVYLFDQNM